MATNLQAIANLRHLYHNLCSGAVNTAEGAKRIAEGILSPTIKILEEEVIESAILIDWPMEPDDPVAFLDMIYERYKKSMGKASLDKEMADIVKKCQMMLFSLWGHNREDIREAMVDLEAKRSCRKAPPREPRSEGLALTDKMALGVPRAYLASDSVDGRLYLDLPNGLVVVETDDADIVIRDSSARTIGIYTTIEQFAKIYGLKGELEFYRSVMRL